MNVSDPNIVAQRLPNRRSRSTLVSLSFFDRCSMTRNVTDGLHEPIPISLAIERACHELLALGAIVGRLQDTIPQASHP